MDFDQVKRDVKLMVSVIIEVPEHKLEDDAKFVDDLFIEESKIRAIALALEKTYHISIATPEINSIYTLNDIYDLLGRKLK